MIHDACCTGIGCGPFGICCSSACQGKVKTFECTRRPPRRPPVRPNFEEQPWFVGYANSPTFLWTSTAEPIDTSPYGAVLMSFVYVLPENTLDFTWQYTFPPAINPWQDPGGSDVLINNASGWLDNARLFMQRGGLLGISVGGAVGYNDNTQAPYNVWSTWAGNEATVATNLINWIVRVENSNDIQFGQIDIDFEDTNALYSNAPYNARAMLSTLTIQIKTAWAAQFGSSRSLLLSHAPQPPYLADPNLGVNQDVYAGYMYPGTGPSDPNRGVMWRLTDAAAQPGAPQYGIDILNIQVYNNSSFYDSDAAVQQWFPPFITVLTEIELKSAPTRVIWGKPLTAAAASDYQTPAQEAATMQLDLGAGWGVLGKYVNGWMYWSTDVDSSTWPYSVAFYNALVTPT